MPDGFIETAAVVVLLVVAALLGLLLRAHRRQHDAVTDRLDNLVRTVATAQRALHEMGRELGGEISHARAGLDALSRNSVSRDDLGQAVKAGTLDGIRRTRKSVANDLLTTYRQLEALQNLHAIADVDRPLPPTRGWASSPDLLLLLTDLVEREKPELVVELGSGTSTLWLALMLRRFEIKGRVTALEHQEPYAAKVTDLVERHGVADLVDVRYAPLEPVELGGRTYPWYARSGWADLTGIGLLFVDGPPTAVGEHARLPALPLLAEHLHPDGVIVLDDMIRADEQEVLAGWLHDYPAYGAEHFRLEKKAAVLRRRRV